MTQKLIDDVWKLETPSEEIACNYINYLYEQACNGKVSVRNQLKKIFESNWEIIKERMEAEGSIWYVWYMDGVRKLLNSSKVVSKK